MPLSAGTRFGPYEILAPIGAGGMGEVYRAKDTRLKRDVALKVLPEAFANDPARMARFQREAEVLAALNHPNIAQVYGVEEHALIMELVEGDPLKGPLPVETALQYARQIADALEAAHEKGIVHRDLKPDNVMITSAGVVKVLDFGLAAVLEGPASSAVDPANSPTLTMRATEAGMIMGTAAYMSPEQASGKPVDKRADIWSFGVVLFEMLSGQPMFGGAETVSHILADVLRARIDLGRLPPETPPAIGDLLRRCLDRDVRNRLRDIGEARVLIGKVLANPSSGAEAQPQAISLRHSKAPWVAAAAMGLIAAIAGIGWWYATRAVERPLVHLDVDLGPEVSLGSLFGADAIISPDGSRLVFVSKSRLFTRRLNQPKTSELAGTEGATSPFFSPDGQWVAFLAGGKLKKISVEGGAAVNLCDAPSFRGGAWGEDHNIIVALISQGGVLLRIPDTGGAPQPLTELAQGESTHRWPQVLPGGKAVLFTANAGTSGFDGANIEVMSFQDRRRKTLQRGGTYGRYLPTSNGVSSRGAGHLVYISKGTLFAVPFDPDTLAVRGTPAPVLPEVSYSSTLGSAQFDFSQTGTLVYRSGGSGGGMVTLQWLDGGGKLQPLPAKPGPYGQPRLSPDGKLVALRVTSGSGSDIWTYDWQRDSMSHLTFGDGTFTFPAWSPDGRYLVFHATSGIFWTRADGAGKPQPLTQTKTAQYPWSFSPDGKRLAFAESGSSGFNLWTLPIENDGGQLRAGKPEVFLQTSNENYPAFSPDGRWIAYRSIESGAPEIFVRSFPDNGGKWQISNSGGIFAVWSRNGHELFYRNPDQQIMVVSYTTKGDSFVPDKPHLWSETRLADTSFFQNLDMSPDGKRFLVLMPVEAPGQQRPNNQVIFLENFFDEVRRRAP
jgi:Tol biopolymer transport system component/predicted Ser/Thr protein kinase